jgi:DNA-binding CsgD family transcriptional regulator/MFS family permease
VLLTCGFLDRRLNSFFASSKASTIAAILFSAGTVILAASPTSHALAYVVPIVCGILTGLGSGYFLILWGRRFAALDNDSIVINSVISIVVGFFLYAIAVQSFPVEIGILISALLPLAELAMFSFAKRHDAIRHTPTTDHGFLPLKHSTVLVRFGLPIALFGIALGFIRTASTTYITSLSSFGAAATIVITVCSAALLTMLLYLTISESSRWNSIFKLIIPCIAIAIFCIPLMEKPAYELSSLAVITGFVLFECTMWIYFGFISQKFNLSPILVYGLGRGILALGFLAGTMFCQMNTVSLLGLNPVVKMSATLVLLIFAYIALPDRSAVERMRKNAVTPKDTFEFLEEAEGHDIAVAVKNEVPYEPAATESKGLPIQTDVNQIEPNTNTSSTFKIDLLPRQVETIANTYLLSRRESEVLECLARGHNAAYICKHLYIAEGTAKTHIRHIYRKLDVHSHHELIEMVEQTEVPTLA